MLPVREGRTKVDGGDATKQQSFQAAKMMEVDDAMPGAVVMQPHTISVSVKQGKFYNVQAG